MAIASVRDVARISMLLSHSGQTASAQPSIYTAACVIRVSTTATIFCSARTRSSRGAHPSTTMTRSSAFATALTFRIAGASSRGLTRVSATPKAPGWCRDCWPTQWGNASRTGFFSAISSRKPSSKMADSAKNSPTQGPWLDLISGFDCREIEISVNHARSRNAAG